MQPTHSLLRPHSWSVRATTTPSHPQLRDLVVHTPEAGNAVSLVCYDSICSVSLYADRPPEYTPLKFSPSTIATGCGLIAVGGQSSELALKSATPGSDWCHQYLPTTSQPTSTGVRTLHSGSINNSIHIAHSPHSQQTPRLLVSSNDEAIRVFDVAGRPPNFHAAKRRRERERRARGSVVDLSWGAAAAVAVDGPAALRGTRASSDPDDHGGETDDEEDASSVEEGPSFDEGGECFLVPIPSLDIRLRTAVNHCSVSPDGKWLVAVGDTNEVFLYDTRAAGYELAHVFTASEDASFSTDWSEDNVTFAVASQDGFVHVYDLRSLPSVSRPASPTLRGANASPRKVAELRTTQPGPAGAARKVRFSPGGKRLDAGLLAFTEHRNRVHVVDARTFETFQIIEVPSSGPTSSTSPPPLRPRPQPPPPPTMTTTFRLSRVRLSPGRPPERDRSGTHTPRDERERDLLEREMRARSELRFAEEQARVRDYQDAVERQRTRAELQESEEEEEEEEEEDPEEEDMMGENDDDEDEDVNDEEEDEQELDAADGTRDDDDDEEEEEDARSAGSSINTTRPRRFDGSRAAALRRSTGSASQAPSGTLNERIIESLLRSDSPDPGGPLSYSTPSDSFVRRNFTAGYFPMMLAPPRTLGGAAPFVPPPPAMAAPSSSAAAGGSIRIPAYASPPHLSSTGLLAAGRTPASFYYATYLPPSGSSSTVPSSSTSYYPIPHLPPADGGPGPAFFPAAAAPLPTTTATTSTAGAYYPASAYFPLDSAPGDLLGLDWDEAGERLFVATGARIWEWEVDRHARRGSAAWGVR